MKSLRLPDGQVLKIQARIFVATPCYSGTIVHECAQAMQLATMHCLTHGVILDWQIAAGFSLVQVGRNWLNAEFLENKEYTHILWLDDDLFFAPDAIMKLFDRHLNAVGGCYCTKHPTEAMFPYQSAGPVVDGLQEVIKLPGGFLLLSRAAVEAANAGVEKFIAKHGGKEREAPNLFDPKILIGGDFDILLKDKSLFGEDFVYCERLIRAGVKVYVETNIDFGHIGRNVWRANLAETLAKEEQEGIKGAGSPEMWGQFQDLPKALESADACN